MKKLLFAACLCAACSTASIYSQIPAEPETLNVPHPSAKPDEAPHYSCLFQSVKHAREGYAHSPDLYVVHEHKGKRSSKFPGVVTYKPKAVKNKKKEASGGALSRSWALACSGKIYLNKKNINGRGGWVRAETNGRYMLSWVEIPGNPQMQNSLGVPSQVKKKFRRDKRSVWADVVISAVLDTEPEEYERYRPTIPVLIDVQKGTTRAVTDMYLFELSQDYPAIGLRTHGTSIYDMPDRQLIDIIEAINISDGRPPLGTAPVKME